MKQSSIDVVGGKNVGEKAAYLIEHEALIKEAGLAVPATTVFASELISASIDPRELAAQALQRFGAETYIALRSSAEGDGRGIGVFNSAFAPTNEAAVANAITSVTDSAKTPHADDFRRQAGLGRGFAVMAQPVIGDVHEDRHDGAMFAPSFSGYGYTKTRFDPDGMINVVAGLGGGVSRDGGEQVTRASLAQAGRHHYEDLDGPMSLAAYIKGLRHDELFGYADTPQTDFRDQRPMLRHNDLDRVSGFALAGDSTAPQWTGLYLRDYTYLTDQEIDAAIAAGERLTSNIVDVDTLFGSAFKTFEPGELMDAMQRMEDIAGYPLYIEWATKFADSGVMPYIVQIAPVDASPHAELEASLPEQVLIIGNNIVGHGEKHATKLVECGNPDDVLVLDKFNRDPANEGYILLYSAHLTSSQGGGYKLDYSHCSNASVVVELGSGVHANGTALDHLGGAIEQTGKFFASADHTLSNRFAELHTEMDEYGYTISSENSRSYGKLTVLENNFKVIADGSQNRLFIGK
ncbi:MAG: hypothetical protein JWO35_340 [Candidatus Saccharibacteria bacterium]|nr:hypothetical protein [Candidatus Saccharibacteria bacterium]